MNKFDLTSENRLALTQQVQAATEAFYGNTSSLEVAPPINYGEVRSFVDQFDFSSESDAEEVIAQVIHGLQTYAVHTPHPGYFGLFNPRAGFASILADHITASFNPQLAAWSHAAFANEAEQKCIREIGIKMGYQDDIDGTFCSGGAESNLTAMLAALNAKYPNFSEYGVIGLSQQPIIYVSSQSHHSVQKAAKICGLGLHAVHTIQTLDSLEMDVAALEKQIEIDIQANLKPMMIIATTGTTGAGAIDDAEALRSISDNYDCWLHIDAAYGAGMRISTQYSKHIGNLGLGDSITVDLHKWFSVPMATSLFLTRHPEVLSETFSIQTDYMPDDSALSAIKDPYVNSIQWSRRFIALKIFLPLAIHGWEVYDETITHQIEMGNYFRERLIANGWIIKNNTTLPIICFTHNTLSDQAEAVTQITDKMIASGETWFSTFPIHGELCFRVCVTNYSTTTDDIDRFVELLNRSL